VNGAAAGNSAFGGRRAFRSLDAGGGGTVGFGAGGGLGVVLLWVVVGERKKILRSG